MQFSHEPVLLQETIDGLKIAPDGLYVDCTVGGGGHSKEICKRLKRGELLGIDQDEEALFAATQTLAPWGDRVTLVHDNFQHLSEILAEKGWDKVDGILMDIGVSSHQFDDEERGFSYHGEATLDMRMDQTADRETARDIVNHYSQEDLTRIFYDYGEERWAKRIAEFIISERQEHEIATTADLVSVIKKAIPKKVRMQEKHPAKRVFQALRIQVNDELGVLKKGLREAVSHLKTGGRLCVISFHSLEDRIVKQEFREMEKDCICPPDFPVCVCHHHREIKRINTKPIVASEEELAENPRAHSAKLRVVEKLEQKK